MKIGFLGTGHITSSVIEGIFKSKLKIKKIYISPRNRLISKKLSKKFKKVTISKNNQQLINMANWVFLAVTPKVGHRILKDLKFKKNQKIISFIFLIYLAWRIGSAGRAQTKRPDEPLRFWQAAMFQLINPKGVSVIISSVTAYTSSATTLASEVFVMFVVFSLVTVGSTFTWTLFGLVIRQVLNTQKRLRLFNVTMASLLLISLLPVFIA